jgi:hypothetical protein
MISSLFYSPFLAKAEVIDWGSFMGVECVSGELSLLAEI